jgi:hypothetical protein
MQDSTGKRMPTADAVRHESVWSAAATMPIYSSLRDDVHADVCIVGAGIAGLTTAYLLAQAGKIVVILDDGELAGGMTSATTAHLTNALDDRYFEMERLTGCNEWLEFGGTCITLKILGGLGNMDDNFLDMPDGRHPGSIDTPVVGRFENDVGSFFANETFAGKPIRVRLFWPVSRPDQPRWEQAFSLDAGATWETNWIMDFTRHA